MFDFIFYLSLAVIVYAYVGYPLLLVLMQLTSYARVKKADIFPLVTVFVSAHNEAGHIEAKVTNLLESDYPREKLEIMVGSDGSTDETYQIIKRMAQEKSIRYTVSFQRLGKPAMLNKMAKDATGEIYIFSDVRQSFAKDAIRNLVRSFADEDVGAVSGDLILQGPGAAGIGFGWYYEKWLRHMEGNIGSILEATGAIYAVRKELFHYLPDVILEDTCTSMNAVIVGQRIVFEPAARAYGMAADTVPKEFIRRVRALVGQLQVLVLMPELLSPAKSKIAFQLISHRVLRLAIPYFLPVLFLANAFLLQRGSFFAGFFAFQAVFYLLAFLGSGSGSGSKGGGVLSGPYEFCASQWAAVVAFMKIRKGEANVVWEKGP